MQNKIKKYPVQNPLLKKYIKFFWEIQAENIQLNHKQIPVRNTDLKFNLSEAPHFVCMNGEEHMLEEVYFSGLRDHFSNTYIKINGKVDMIGVCFLPEGLFPFLKIPVSEFRNQLLGASEIGFNLANTISERLKEAPDVAARFNILENELAALLDNVNQIPGDFRQLFNTLKHSDGSLQISDFCLRHNIGSRKLERLYNKYVGLTAKTYGTLNRFQNSINQLLNKDYSKLSDIAYGNGYFDQMHFIREFKRYAGNTPGNFIHQNNSMLQVGKLA